MRVFRDVASLAATADLMAEIERVLRETRYLILLASPSAAKSPWVPREVRFWCDNKSSETLLIAVTEGKVEWNRPAKDFDWEKTSALPPVLAGRFKAEPLIVDLSWANEAKVAKRLGPRHPEMREATATLGAAIHGRDRDALIGDDIRRHRHAIMAAAGAALLIVGFAGVATWQFLSARRERDRAVEQAQQATTLALAASSGVQLDEQPKTALLLGLEAYKLRPRAEARSAIVAALQFSARTGAGPILRRHMDIARAAAFSPDGQTLVSVGDDAVVRVWDVRRRREVGFSPLRGHDNLVASVDVSPDGRLVATGSWDGTVRLWDLHGDDHTGTVLRQGAAVDSVAFSPYGDLLAVASGPDVELWAYRKKSHITTHTAVDDVDQVRFSRDGILVAGAAGVSGDAFVWDFLAGKAWSLHHGGIAGSVGFSWDGRTLAVGGSAEGTSTRGGTVSLWDVSSHRMIGKPVRTRTDLVRGVALARDGRTLLAAGQEGSLVRVDVQRGRLVSHLPWVSEGQGIWGLATSRDRETLAIPVSDGSVRMWRMNPPRGFGSALRGSPGEIEAIAVSRRGELVAAAHDGGSIDLWDASRGRVLHTLDEHADGVSAVAFGPSGKTVLFAARGYIRVWHPDSGGVATMPDRIRAVTHLAVRRDGRMLATGEIGGRIRLWDVRARRQIGAPIETPSTGLGEVSFLAFSRDGRRVAFGAGDFAGQAMRVAEVDPRHVVLSTDLVGSLDSGAALPDGTVRATAIGHPRVTLLTADPPSKQHVRVESASATAMSPDGSTLVVGTDDGTVHAFDAVALLPLGSEFGGGSSRVTEMAFSGDGETFAAADEDGSVRVWHRVFWGNVGEIERRACLDAGSSIPPANWGLAAPGIPYRASCG